MAIFLFFSLSLTPFCPSLPSTFLPPFFPLSIPSILSPFLQLSPENAEEYIEYLVSIGRLDEAALKLAEIVNKVHIVCLVTLPLGTKE